MEFNIEEELKKLPGKPGVYLMHDADDAIIYVGKAVNLKNRVRQYFQDSRKRTPKIEKMVSKIARFEYVMTDSELEALVLECNLIKEHRPKYNTMLKDDKGYPYIRVTVEEPFPRVMMVHKRKKDKSRYFGPYTNAGAVKDTLELLQKLFCIRTCNRVILGETETNPGDVISGAIRTCNRVILGETEKNPGTVISGAIRTCNRVIPGETANNRPCLNYHIHQCSAPCQGLISREAYGNSIRQVIDFLNGKYAPILSVLEEKMKKASAEMEFEEAIRYRDLMESVRHIAQRQKMTDDSMEDRDIIAFALDSEKKEDAEETDTLTTRQLDAVVQVFFVREGKLIGRDHFHLRVAEGESCPAIMTSFVKQFYAGTPFIPRELFLQYPLEEEDVIARWLSQKRGKKVLIKVPKKGEKERLVELAQRNARMVLDQDRERIRREEQRTTGAMRQIEDWLGLKEIHRVEAYDISNISGFESVGSMVVYEDGKPKRSDFRKFRIQWVKGANDYASMKEVLTRRFAHAAGEDREDGFVRLPDLIMMDGGKGQVNIALDVLAQMGLTIPVCGMVKDDRHRTRGIYYNNREIPIDRHAEGFLLVTRIQDEAHRFAIEYHRSLRNKEGTRSILDEIPGIGPKRRNALMRHFQTLEALLQADEKTLLQAEGMNAPAARAVYEFFHSGAPSAPQDSLPERAKSHNVPGKGFTESGEADRIGKEENSRAQSEKE